MDGPITTLAKREMPGMGMGLMNMNLAFGVLLVCVMLTAVMFGILTVQVVAYSSKFSKQDGRAIRWTVYTVWMLELIHQIFSAILLYEFVIHQFGNKMFMMTRGWHIGMTAITESMTAFIVQLFYARRGWILNRNRWPFSAFTVLLASLSLGTGLTAGVELIRLRHFGDFMLYKWLQASWFGSAAAADLMVSFIVVSSLRGTRTGWAASGGFAGLITYTLSTGVLISAVAITLIIFYTLIPNSLTHPALSLVLARLYSNSLLASLNLRGSWIRDSTEKVLATDPSLSESSWASHSKPGIASKLPITQQHFQNDGAPMSATMDNSSESESRHYSTTPIIVIGSSLSSIEEE